MEKSNEDKYYHVTNGKCSGCSDDPLTENGKHDEINLTWDQIKPYIGYVEPPTQSELLTIALNEKHAEIDKAMGENVCTEFQSNVLGSIHSYDCREVDQANIAQAIRISENVGHADYLAKPTGGFFQMIQHSLAELQAVDAEMFAHISSNRTIARSKKSEAVTAHENGDIEAIKAVPVTPWQ